MKSKVLGSDLRRIFRGKFLTIKFISQEFISSTKFIFAWPKLEKIAELFFGSQLRNAKKLGENQAWESSHKVFEDEVYLLILTCKSFKKVSTAYRINIG